VRAVDAAPQPHVVPVLELLHCLRRAAEAAARRWSLCFLISWFSGEGRAEGGEEFVATVTARGLSAPRRPQF
jgi:hypothetical protein